MSQTCHPNYSSASWYHGEDCCRVWVLWVHLALVQSATCRIHSCWEHWIVRQHPLLWCPSLQSSPSPEVHGSGHNHPEDLFKSSGLPFVPRRGQSMGQAAKRLRHQSWGQRETTCYWRWWTSRLSRALCEVWLLQHHLLGGGNCHWYPTCTGNELFLNRTIWKEFCNYLLVML